MNDETKKPAHPRPSDPDHDAKMARPDGHRYEAPESDDETDNKSYGMLLLAGAVVVLMILVATGIVPLYSW